jgi:hypothetical protein
MNHYDDLQRFKDRTRTQSLDFKDFSAQNQANDQGSWAIINQLLPQGESDPLAAGGHVSLITPQAVSPDMFALGEVTPVPASVVIETEHPKTLSILQDVAGQLAAEPQKVEVPVAPVVQQAPEVSPSAPAEVDFSRLFAPAPAPASARPAAEKNQSLNTLLERIATCR